MEIVRRWRIYDRACIAFMVKFVKDNNYREARTQIGANFMSMINKEIGDFSVQAFHNDEFKTVTKDDVLGHWSVFFFYPADFTFVCRFRWPSGRRLGS